MEYKWKYLGRLWERIKGRVAGLESGVIELGEMMVPGVVPMVEALRARSVSCYLVSGTDEVYVLDEATALELLPYFANIYGALDDYQNYSKRMIEEGRFPHRDMSILAAGYRLRVPVAVHMGIGHDSSTSIPIAMGRLWARHPTVIFWPWPTTSPNSKVGCF